MLNGYRNQLDWQPVPKTAPDSESRKMPIPYHHGPSEDYYIASRLAFDETLNCYRRFFDAFAGSNFLMFNYDSLPETFVFPSEAGIFHLCHLPARPP